MNKNNQYNRTAAAIDKDIYEEFKEYCNKHNYRIGRQLSDVIKEYLEKEGHYETDNK